VFEVPRGRALEIDDEEDLERAEQIAAFARSVPR
jgi:CMP-N-acetylneuraminic acid synthetase